MSHLKIPISSSSGALLIPSVPPTPGPRSVETIRDDTLKQRFAGITIIQKDPSRILEDYFHEYDAWEKYDERKVYSKRPYIAIHKGIMRNYHSFLCILEDENGEESEYYVVAKRLRNDLEDLEPFCPCLRCRFFPARFIWCPNCTRCLKTGGSWAKPEYIEQAKEAKKRSLYRIANPTKYDIWMKRIYSIPIWIIIFCVLLVLLFVYLLF